MRSPKVPFGRGIRVHTLFLVVACSAVALITSKRSCGLPKPSTQVHASLCHLDRVLRGCGAICEHSAVGTPSKFFNYISKPVDCIALLTNPAIDAAMNETEPPPAIPADLLPFFTYDGKVSVHYYHKDKTLFNQRYLSKTAATPTWEQQHVDSWIELCRNGSLEGTYGVKATRELVLALKQANIAGASVLVIGSERPWVEACVLANGAKHVTTLEYGKISSLHERVSTFTPTEMRARATDFIGSFDAVVSYSSIEHSGLGRYGDAMNPWGDRQAVARAWCMTKKGGRIALGVPAGADAIMYNAHRMYGPVQLPHLLANWQQVWQSPPGFVHGIWVCEK